MATPNIVPRAEGEGGLGTAAKGWGGLFVTNVTADSSTQGGKLILAGNDGAAMQSGSRLGVIEFKGAESASALTIGARIEAICDAGWSSSENGASLKFYTTDADATEFNVLTLDSNKKSTFTQTLTTAATTPIGILLDTNYSGVAAQDSTGLHLDFDRTVAGSGTAAHNDIGIDLDVNSASLGTSTLKGMDIDVVGAASGTSAATGIDLLVNGSDANIGMKITTQHEHLRMVWSGDGDDYAKFGVESGGVTTFSTTGDNGTTLANFIMDIDGDIELNADGGDITFKDAGTTLAAIDADGQLTSNNYRTIYVDAGAMVPSVTNGGAAATEELAANKPTVDYIAFDASTDEYAQFKLVMPPEWDRGTVRARYYWKASGTDTGTVVWALEGLTYTNDEAFMDTAFGTPAAAGAQAGSGTDNDLHITPNDGTAACTVQGTHREDNLILFRITRDISGDDYAEDAHLLGVNIQYREAVANKEAVWE